VRSSAHRSALCNEAKPVTHDSNLPSRRCATVGRPARPLPAPVHASFIGNLVSASLVTPVRSRRGRGTRGTRVHAASRRARDAGLLSEIDSDLILSRAVSTEASDVHITPLVSGALVRYRVDGRLQTIQTVPRDAVRLVVNRSKVLARRHLCAAPARMAR